MVRGRRLASALTGWSGTRGEALAAVPALVVLALMISPGASGIQGIGPPRPDLPVGSIAAALSATASASPGRGPYYQGPMFGVVPYPIDYRAIASGGSGTYTYYWMFGDGGHSALSTGGYTYLSAGRFGVQVIVNDTAGGSVTLGAGTLSLGGNASSPGLGWSRVATSAAPSSRVGAMMAYDPLDGYVLLFGGCRGTTPLNDTWTYAGGVWTNLTSTLSLSPPARCDAYQYKGKGGGMVVDPVTGEITVVGGYPGLTDVWRYHAGAWSSVATTGTPPPNIAGVVADPVDGYILVTSFLTSSGDTSWSLTSNAWSELSFTTAQPHNWTARPVWDSTSGDALLFAGQNCNYCADVDAWPTGWSPIYTGVQGYPAPVGMDPGALLVDDPALGGVLLYGSGYCTSGICNDVAGPQTWSLTGGTAPWVSLTASLPAAPPSQEWASGAWVPTDHDVLFLGTNATGGAEADTWTFGGAGSGPSPLRAAAAASPTTGTVPLPVHLNGTATGGQGPDTWTWNFSDQSPLSHAENPSHTYNASGTYLANLTVQDALGHVAYATVSVKVSNTNGSLRASASASPLSGSAPLTVYFSGGAQGGLAPYAYAWTFGDTTGSTAQNPSHTYASAAAYSVSLQVTDARGATSTAGLTISVASGPPPLSVSPSASPTSGVAPLHVTFQANPAGGSGGYTALWQFGDGASLTGLNVSHNYTSASTYTASVSLTDSSGASIVGSLTITVDPGCATCPLSATIAASPDPGVVGSPVGLWANASGGAAPYFASWSFGDGTNGTGTVAYHTYLAAGSYPVDVQVFDSAGHEVVDRLTETVNACSSGCSGYTPPSISLSASPASGNPPLSSNVSYRISGGVGPWAVNLTFGDGAKGWNCSTSLGSCPNYVWHTYATVGTFTLTGVVVDSTGHSATTTATVYVSSSSPLSATGEDSPASGTSPLNVTFWGNVTGGTLPYTLQWSFGDGDTGSGVAGGSTFHIFRTSGSFQPHLLVRDEAGHSINVTLAIVHVSEASSTPAAPASVPAWEVGAVSVGALVAGVLAVLAVAQVRRREAERLRRQGRQMVAAMEADARRPPSRPSVLP